MSREVNRSLEGVHVFSIKGCDLAYDAATGALHRLTPVGKAVLEVAASNADIPKEGKHVILEDVLAKIGDKFPHEEIKEAFHEFSELRGKTLWGEDEALCCAENRSALDAGLKAMCLDVAHDCNLACRYCFASSGLYGGHPSVMRPDIGKRAIDFLVRESKNRKYLDVDFFGGEPLLAFDTVKECVRYARHLEKQTGKVFRFTLTTNCTLLTDEAIDFLNRENISLILSIDGRKEVHDAMRKWRDGSPSFDTVLYWAQKAVRSRRGRDYYVRGTYTKENLDFAEDVKDLYRHGFRRISLEPAVGEGYWGIGPQDMPALSKSYEDLTDFYLDCRKRGDPFLFYHFDLGLKGGMCKERRVTGCGAGYEYVAVTPEGDVYPCHQLVGIQAYRMGDISSGISENSSVDLKERFFRARLTNKEECVRCWARYLCGGGCHARAIFANGDIHKPDQVACQIMRLRLEYALYAQYIISV